MRLLNFISRALDVGLLTLVLFIEVAVLIASVVILTSLLISLL